MKLKSIKKLSVTWCVFLLFASIIFTSCYEIEELTPYYLSQNPDSVIYFTVVSAEYCTYLDKNKEEHYLQLPVHIVVIDTLKKPYLKLLFDSKPDIWYTNDISNAPPGIIYDPITEKQNHTPSNISIK